MQAGGDEIDGDADGIGSRDTENRLAGTIRAKHQGRLGFEIGRAIRGRGERRHRHCQSTLHNAMMYYDVL